MAAFYCKVGHNTRIIPPNPRGRTIETVLITASPPTDDLVREGYFHRILRIEDLFG